MDRASRQKQKYALCNWSSISTSSNETEKLVWLEKFEHILSEVYTKWNGVIILAGDLNIDLLNGSKESQRRYKDILHSFSLRQHITSPARKSKTLIDHVISTILDRVIHHDVLDTEEISVHDVRNLYH